MCTVTWTRGLGRLELYTNRDEQRSRPAAEPPRERRTPGGARYLSPRDPAGDGTWVAANEFGLVLCLVNHYQAREPGAGPLLSRGTVVTDLADARDPGEALERGRGLPFERLRGFRLLALSIGSEPVLLGWDGERATEVRGEGVPLPLISSSVRLPEVERSRRAVFAALEAEHGGVHAQMLAAFHRSEAPEPGPLSVSMVRDDAWTVSRTRVAVDEAGVTMGYAPGRPSERPPEHTVRLDLSARRPA